MFVGRGIAKLITLQAKRKATTGSAVLKPRATRTSVLRERSNKLRISSNHAFRQTGTPSPILRQLKPSRDSQNITSNGFRRSETRTLSTGDLGSSTMLAAVEENQPPIKAKDADSDSALLLDSSLNDCQLGVLMPTEIIVSASAGQVSPRTTEQFNTSSCRRVSQYCEKYGYVISESIDARLVIMGEDEESQTRKKPTIQESNQNPKPYPKDDPREPGLQLKTPKVTNKCKGDKTGTIINALDLRQVMRKESFVRKKPKTILPKQPPSIEANSKKQGMGKNPRVSSRFKRPAPEKANNMAESLPLNRTVEDICGNQPSNSNTPRNSDGPHTSFHPMLNSSTAPISLVSLCTPSAGLPHDSDGLENKMSFGTAHQHRSRAFGSFGNVGQGIKDFGKKVGRILPSRRSYPLDIHVSKSEMKSKSARKTVAVTLSGLEPNPRLSTMSQNNNITGGASGTRIKTITPRVSGSVETVNGPETENIGQKEQPKLESPADQPLPGPPALAVRAQSSTLDSDVNDTISLCKLNEDPRPSIAPVNIKACLDETLDVSITTAESCCRDLIDAAVKTDNPVLQKSLLDIADSIGTSVMAIRNARIGVLHLEQMIGQVVILLESSSIRAETMIGASALSSAELTAAKLQSPGPSTNYS